MRFANPAQPSCFDLVVCRLVSVAGVVSGPPSVAARIAWPVGRGFSGRLGLILARIALKVLMRGDRKQRSPSMIPPSSRSRPSEASFLVGADQPAVGRDIRGENGGQPEFHAFPSLRSPP